MALFETVTKLGTTKVFMYKGQLIYGISIFKNKDVYQNLLTRKDIADMQLSRKNAL